MNRRKIKMSQLLLIVIKLHVSKKFKDKNVKNERINTK